MEDLKSATGSRSMLSSSSLGVKREKVRFTGKDMRKASSRVDGLLSNGLHFAGISNGDWEPKQKLYDIVKKDSNYVCHGRRREQGSRGDLDRIRRIADEDGLRAVSGWKSAADQNS